MPVAVADALNIVIHIKITKPLTSMRKILNSTFFNKKNNYMTHTIKRGLKYLTVM